MLTLSFVDSVTQENVPAKNGTTDIELEQLKGGFTKLDKHHDRNLSLDNAPSFRGKRI